MSKSPSVLHGTPGSHKTKQHALFALLLAMLATLLAGCGTTSDTGAKAGSTASSLPAVTASTPTVSAGKPAPSPTAQGAQSPPPTGSWAQSSVAASGATFSYRYPPSWSHDLVYCPKGGQTMGAHLPVGCASTDFLSGKKLQDVMPSIKVATAKAMTVAGRRVLTQTDVPQDTDKAARTYTAILYSADGTAPVFGFVTYIGPGTPAVDQARILSLLDGVASTLSAEK